MYGVLPGVYSLVLVERKPAMAFVRLCWTGGSIMADGILLRSRGAGDTPLVKRVVEFTGHALYTGVWWRVLS